MNIEQARKLIDGHVNVHNLDTRAVLTAVLMALATADDNVETLQEQITKLRTQLAMLVLATTIAVAALLAFIIWVALR